MHPSARNLALFILIFSPLVSQTMAKPPKRVVEIEGITQYQLDNGLQILLFPDDSKPSVTVNLTIFVGSRHEGYGEAGMAHLLEHMLFKGTPLHPNIDNLFQERGAQFNGTTWTDRTNYYETMPASDDNLEFGIKLEADRMTNSYIKGEDLNSEMTVVRNEFERGENSPSRVLSQRISSAAYDWHNYGKSTIGNRSDIERVPLPKLRTFYKRHYQPDNAMLIVAGKFDRDNALKYIDKYFGVLQRPMRELDKTYTEEPAQDGERTVVLRRVGEAPIVAVAYHIPASPHEDFAPVQVLSHILAMEPSGRMYKSLVETKKAALVSGGSYAFHDPGLMVMEAELGKNGNLEDVRKTLLSEIEKIGAEGVSELEVDRAKQQILKRREQEVANSTRLAVSLSNWAAQGDWRLYFLYRDRVEKVKAADIQRVADRYLKRNNRTVGLFIPTEEAERVAIPATPNVEELVANYKGRDSIAKGEQFDPSPENIESRTKRGTIGEGIQYALLPKKTRGEVVQLQLTLRYGDKNNLKGLETACGLMPTMMTRGTKNLSRQAIQDELDSLRASLSASGSLGSASFAIQTKREDLAQVLPLLTQILREPSFPKDEFDVHRRERLVPLEAAISDPQRLAITELRRRVSPYPKDSVRYVPSVEEGIQRLRDVDLDEVKKLHAEYLGPHAGQLSIVGDFDVDETLPLLEAMFKGWDAKHGHAHIPIVAFTEVPGSLKSIETPDKENAAYFAGYAFKMSDSHPDYPALLIGNYILGGGSLASRLGERIRQKEGLSYGVFSAIHGEALDDRASLTVMAISNPQNMPKVIKYIGEELDLILDKGITDQELSRAKQGYLQSQMLGRSNDGQLASVLNGTSRAKRSMDYYGEMEKKIGSLTRAEINAAMKKHLDLSRLVIVTAGDFAAVKKEGEK